MQKYLLSIFYFSLVKLTVLFRKWWHIFSWWSFSSYLFDEILFRFQTLFHHPPTYLPTNLPLIYNNSVPSKMIMYVDYGHCRIVDVMVTQDVCFRMGTNASWCNLHSISSPVLSISWIRLSVICNSYIW